MASLLDGVDQRTQLAGENRLELLLFRLTGKQLYGINVFKVQEVIRCPRLTQIPNSKSVICGIANMRGKTIPVIDLGMALGKPALPQESVVDSFVIIADYNRSVQGFLVSGVERIVNMHWENILPPPKGAGGISYLTAVTRVDEQLVEIIDVEKVLEEISGSCGEVSDEIKSENEQNDPSQYHILVADDSSVARNQIKRTMDQVGLNCTLVNDGRQALDYLKSLADKDGPITNYISLVISDIEMPNMDGYTLTTEIRKHPKLKDLYIILHTSLSGVFNEALVHKVGANKFIPKFKPNELALSVINGIEQKNKSVA